MTELKFKIVGAVKDNQSRGQDLINQAFLKGLTPIIGTLTECENYFYVRCEQSCWLRVGK